jgi:hypothetical protein
VRQGEEGKSPTYKYSVTGRPTEKRNIRWELSGFGGKALSVRCQIMAGRKEVHPLRNDYGLDWPGSRYIIHREGAIAKYGLVASDPPIFLSNRNAAKGGSRSTPVPILDRACLFRAIGRNGVQICMP